MRAMPTRLRRLLWAIGALYLLYLVIANVFLNTLAHRLVDRRPDAFHAHWSWAWSALPMRLHVHDLQMGGHARHLLWQASGSSARGRIAVMPLLRRELRFVSVHARDVAVDVRHVAGNHAPPPYRDDAWRISAHGLRTLSLRHLRWDALQVDGHGAGDVGFVHQLRGGATQLLDSRLAMQDARVRLGKRVLSPRARATLRFAVDPFTHADPPGWHKARRARAVLTVDALTPPLALGVTGPPAGRTDTGGHLHGTLDFDHGELAAGGWLTWSGAVLAGTASGPPQQLHGKLELQVRPQGLVLRVSVPPASGAHAPDARLEAQLDLAGRRLLPIQPWADEVRRVSGKLEARWHFATLRWLAPLLVTRPWLHLDGEGELDARLAVKAGRVLPGGQLDIPHVALRARLLGNVLAGDVHAHAEVSGRAAQARIATRLQADRFVMAPASAPDQPTVRGRDLVITSAADTDLAKLRDTLDAHLRFQGADVPDLRAYNHYLPGSSLHFLGGRGRLDTDVHVDGHGDIHDGHLRLRSADMRVALGPSQLAGRVDLQTRLALARRRGSDSFDLDTLSLRLDGLTVVGHDAPPWWARVVIRHGRLDWHRPMRLRGRAAMQMKDVSLLLSLFADRGAFPAWIARVVDAGRAQATAQVQVQHGDVVLDQLVAHNRRIELQAHLRIRNGHPDGDLYARWGILGLGVALHDGQRDLHLLHARKWYLAQPDLLAAPGAGTPGDGAVRDSP